jgi:predicted nucleic acid-binding protein
MKCVLDSSVAFKWVVPEADSAKAQQLADEFARGIHELLAPDIFTTEVAHALTRAERQGRITPGEALRLWTVVMTTAPRLEASTPLAPRAIAISSKMRVGVYDCLYVALAEQESCQLVTADEKLLKNLQPTYPFIVSLSALP